MTAPTARRNLPLLSLTPVHNGGRDRMTCKYRCGDACFTECQPGTLGNCDAMYLYPVDGPQAGHLQQFLSVPVGAECCGPYIDLHDNTVLAAVQHPGEVSGAVPSNVISTYPYLGDGQPRPGVFHAYRPKSNGGGNGKGRSNGRG